MPESWTGRCFEDFAVGDVYEHQLGRTITLRDLRKHRQLFDMFEVVRDPIDDLVTVTAELLGRHVTERWLIHFSTQRHATSRLLQGLFKHSPSVNHGCNCHGVMPNAVDDAEAINKAFSKILVIEFRHNVT